MELFNTIFKGVQNPIYDTKIIEQGNDTSEIYEKMSISEITLLLITKEVIKIDIEIKKKD